MATRARLRFVYAHTAWTLATIVVLAALGALSLDLVFVVSLIGFLVLVELTAPVAVSPAWRRRLTYVVALGLVVFAYLVVRRILAILPEGLL